MVVLQDGYSTQDRLHTISHHPESRPAPCSPLATCQLPGSHRTQAQQQNLSFSSSFSLNNTPPIASTHPAGDALYRGLLPAAPCGGQPRQALRGQREGPCAWAGCTRDGWACRAASRCHGHVIAFPQSISFGRQRRLLAFYHACSLCIVVPHSLLSLDYGAHNKLSLDYESTQQYMAKGHQLMSALGMMI